MGKKFDSFVERSRVFYARLGSSFSTKSLERKFIKYFESGEKVILSYYNTNYIGTVHIGSGPQPYFWLRTKKVNYILSNKWVIVNEVKLDAKQSKPKFKPGPDLVITQEYEFFANKTLRETATVKVSRGGHIWYTPIGNDEYTDKDDELYWEEWHARLLRES